METVKKSVLLIGLGGRGRAVGELLLRSGADVTAIDPHDTPALREETASLRQRGVQLHLGATSLPAGAFDLCVLSPAVPTRSPLVQEALNRPLKLIGELELAYQHIRCLALAVTGTNGKGSVAELIERMLVQENRRIVVAGQRAQPVCDVVEGTAEADYLVLQVNAFQLERVEHFRPVVAVLTNLTPDHLDRYGSREEYVRATARVFANQQAFDWAIIQREALEVMRGLDLPVPSKVVTFSAHDREADLYLDRGLILSRLANWSGPLLDLDQCRMRGPHNAENFMAALAVGRALRVPLEHMAGTLKAVEPARHRFELVAEVAGVQYINDSKATNPHALEMALNAARPGPAGQPNLWLVAGGRDKGADYHSVAALVGQRVKGAFLFGEGREKLQAAWGLFTPCTPVGSLLEAVAEAAKRATEGDVVLLSPACSCFDQFRDYQHRGETFCSAVKSIGGGLKIAHPHIHG
ncbi:MAG: UDP-N-acetylmuramoyl-L-alanine--D-glutamate ligase [Verrucomicrobia bacterium]|jgi:UDP-N-acetylmuramoylalanine--D-glutamate ligase|nr:UDP-N-acetylmuramoyl-L-alanine--D-glutamate ligase [Verrucomicrobiota bacterium]